MPNPTRSDVHVDRVLTNISIAYRQTANFIAGQVFPTVLVDDRSGVYYKYSRRDWLRVQSRKRGESEESAGGGWDMEKDNYFCDIYAVHKDIDRNTANESDVDLRMDATDFCTEQNLLRLDIEWADAFFKPGVWANNLVGVGAAPGPNQFLQWNDPSSTPLQDIRTMRRQIGRTTGKSPNRFVVSPDVWDVLIDHPDVVDRIKYSQAGIVTEELFATMIGVQKVVVASSVVDLAIENVDETVDQDLVNFVLGKGALLVYAADRPSLKNPSGGYQIMWRNLEGSNGTGMRVHDIPMDNLNSDRIEGEICVDQKLTAPEVGAFFDSAVA